MSPVYSYPPEMREYIIAHKDDYDRKEMAEKCNEVFGTNLTPTTLGYYVKNHKIKGLKRRKIYSSTFPEELDAYIREHVEGRTTAELLDLIQKETPYKLEYEQLRAFKKNHKIKSGCDSRFKKGCKSHTKGKHWEDYMDPEAIERAKRGLFVRGQKPHSWRPVGTTSKTSDGYITLKVQDEGTERDRWAFLHKIIYEENFGPIPKGYIVSFKDGDRTNLDPSNLIALSKAEHAMLNNMGYRSTDAEITETGVNIVKLRIAIRKKEGGKKNATDQGAGSRRGNQPKNKDMEK